MSAYQGQQQGQGPNQYPQNNQPQQSNQAPRGAPLTAADYDRVASVEKDFKILKKFDDPRFGNVAIIEQPGNTRRLMMKEKVFNSKADLTAEIEAVRRRIAVHNSNLLPLVDYSTGSRSDFCSTFYWIKLYFEYPDHDLEQELRRRARYNIVGLNGSELTHMLYQVSDAGAFLNANGFIHGDICPETIEMDNPERYRLVEKFGDLSRPDLIQASKLWTKADIYAAPEVHGKIRSGTFKPAKVFAVNDEMKKADVYSLGLTMLQAGTGQNVQSIYSKQGPANIEVLARLKNAFFERFGQENNLLATTVASMVEVNPASRPFFHQIMANIPPYNDVRAHLDQERARGGSRNSVLPATNPNGHSQSGIHSMYSSNLYKGGDAYQEYIKSNAWETGWGEAEVFGAQKHHLHHGAGPLGRHLPIPQQPVVPQQPQIPLPANPQANQNRPAPTNAQPPQQQVPQQPAPQQQVPQQPAPQQQAPQQDFHFGVVPPIGAGLGPGSYGFQSQNPVSAGSNFMTSQPALSSGAGSRVSNTTPGTTVFGRLARGDNPYLPGTTGVQGATAVNTAGNAANTIGGAAPRYNATSNYVQGQAGANLGSR